MDVNENINEKWIQKRRTTFKVIMYIYFIMGVENSANIATLWIYLTTLMDTKHPAVFYGLINASFYIPTLLISAAVSRWADKTRRFKLCLTVIIYINMSGSILYLIPFSPYFALCGKFFQGFCLVLLPLMTAEVARSYHSDVLQHKIAVLSGIYTFGFSIGPVIPTIFEKVDFWIGGVHIAYGNISGLVVLMLLIVLQVLIALFSHSLSKEYDLKQNNEELTKLNEIDVNDENKSWIGVMKNVATKPDISFMIFLSIYATYLEIALFRMLPIIILEHLHYGTIIVNISFIGFSCMNIILLAIMVICKINDRYVFYCGFFSLVTIIVMAGAIFTFSLHLKNIGINAIALITFLLVFGCFVLGDDIFNTVVCAKLTSSCNQGYVGSIREFFKQLGSITGAYTAVYLSNNLVLFCTLLVVTALILIFIMLLRKNILMYPKPVV